MESLDILFLGTLAVIAGVVDASKKTRKNNAEDCGCGCKGDCGKVKKAESLTQPPPKAYPLAFDPALDFLPRYRYPPHSSWNEAYNPSDPFRPLDYQVMQEASPSIGGVY